MKADENELDIILSQSEGQFFSATFPRKPELNGHESDVGSTTQETTQETTLQTSEMILIQLRSDPTITIRDLARIIGLTPGGIKHHITKMKKEGKIKHVGPTKRGYWEITDEK